MNDPGTLLSLLGCMLTNLDQRIDHMLKGINVIIEHDKIHHVGSLDSFQHIDKFLLLISTTHMVTFFTNLAILKIRSNNPQNLELMRIPDFLPSKTYYESTSRPFDHDDLFRGVDRHIVFYLARGGY